MRARQLVILLIIFALFLLIPAFSDGWSDAGIIGIYPNGDFLSNHPSELIFDADGGTYASFESGGRGGRVEVEIASSRYLAGLSIDADLDPQSMISLEFQDEQGRIQIVPGARFTAISGEAFFDLSAYRIESSRFIFSISSENAEQVEIRSIDPVFYSDQRRFGEIQPEDIVSNDLTLLSSNEYQLFDQYPDSQWWIEYPDEFVTSPGTDLWKSHVVQRVALREEDGVPAEVASFIVDSHPFQRDSGDLSGPFVEISYPAEHVAERFAAYVSPDAAGMAVVAVRIDGTWQEIDSFDLSALTGWIQRDIPIALRNFTELRITLVGDQQLQGGLGDFSLLGEYSPGSPARVNIRGYFGERNYFGAPAVLPDISDIRRPMVEYTLVGTQSAGISLNGLPLNSYVADSQNGSRILYRAELPEPYMSDDINFLIPGDGASIDSMIIVSAGDFPVEPPSADSFFDGKILSDPVYLTTEQLFSAPDEALLLETRAYFNDSAPLVALEYTGVEYRPISGDSQGAVPLIVYRHGEGVQGLALTSGDITEISFSTLESDANAIFVDVINHSQFSAFGQSEVPGYIIGHSDAWQGFTYVNDIAASHKGNYFWIPTEDALYLSVGENEVVIQSNKAGRLSSVRSFVLLNNDEFIWLTLDQGQEVHFTDSQQFIVSGELLNYFADLYIDGEYVPRSSQQFSHQVDLDLGYNLISIAVEHNLFNIGYVGYLRVFRTPVQLELEIYVPEDGAILGAEAVEVRGGLLYDLPTSVTVNGIPTLISGSNFFTDEPVQLPAGMEEITVNAIGLSGKSVTRTISVRRDVTPPVVSDVLPAGGIFDDQLILVSGMVTDDNPVRVLINGTAAELSGEYFQAYVQLPEGPGELSITAIDIAGNTTNYPDIEVFVDTVAPDEFQVESDVNLWTNNTTPRLSYAAVDTGSGISHYEVSIDGSAFVPRISPYLLPFQRDGGHSIIVRAYDNAGNHREAEFQFIVDTIPPEPVSSFRSVPGDGVAELRWQDVNFSNGEFRIGQGSEMMPPAEWTSVAHDEGITESIVDDTDTDSDIVLEYTYEYPGQNGDSLSFAIIAVDLAGNVSEPVYSSVTVGIAEKVIDQAEVQSIEYATANIDIPRESIPQEVVAISISEVSSPEIAAESVTPIVGSIYSFSGYNSDNEILEEVQFSREYQASIRYDDADLPAGADENSLQVFYYDPLWAFWLPVNTVSVDIENNVLSFTADHFSLYSVQETKFAPVDASNVNEANISIAGRQGIHGDLIVSPQSGAVSTSITDLTLPGKNGLDLILQRVYSSAQAEADGRIQRIRNTPENTGIHFGAGWRLNVPTARVAADRYGYGSGLEVSLPDGTRVNTATMYKQNVSNAAASPFLAPGDFTFDANHITRAFYSHDQNGIAILVNFKKLSTPVQISVGTETAMTKYEIAALRVIDHQGRIYIFDGNLYLVEIHDPSRTFSITYDRLANHQINTITDTHGRVIRFEYDETTDTIERISTDTLNGTYSIDYGYISVDSTYDGDSPNIVSLLNSVIDSEGRQWTYTYVDEIIDRWVPEERRTTSRRYRVDQDTGEGYWYVVSRYYVDSVRNSQFTAHYIDTAAGPGIGYQKINYSSAYFSVGSYVAWTTTPPEQRIRNQVQPYQERILATKLSEGDLNTDADFAVTTYSYNSGISSSTLADRWQHGFYNISTTVNDGRSTTTYRYTQITKDTPTGLDFPWYVDSGEENGDIDPYRVPLVDDIRTKIGSQTVNLVEFEYDSYARTTKRTVTRGAHRQETDYAYDSWGNIRIADELTSGPGYEYQVKTYTEYVRSQSGTTDLPGAQIGQGITWLPSPLTEGEALNAGVMIPAAPLYQAVEYRTETDVLSQTEIAYTYYEYGSDGRMSSSAVEREGNWEIRRYEYYLSGDATGQLSSVLNEASGLLTAYEYDYPDNSDYYQITTSRTDIIEADGGSYDSVYIEGFETNTGLPAWKTDPRGYTTEFSYDSIGRLTRTVSPDDDDELWWNPRSASAGNRSGNPDTSYQYDDLLRTVTVTDPMDFVEVYRFDVEGKLIGKTSLTMFDTDGSELASARAVNVDLQYDLNDNIRALTNELGLTTSYEYDALDRLKTVLHPLRMGNQEQRRIGYDYQTLVESTVDERGVRHERFFDFSGNLLREELYDAFGRLSAFSDYSYDAMGNRISITDSEGNATVNDYNNRGQLIRTVSPSAEHVDSSGMAYRSQPVVEYAYDLAGRQVTTLQTIDGSLAELQRLHYDQLGNSIRIEQFYTDTDGVAQIAETLQYFDPAGNLEEVIDPRSNGISTSYTARGQVKTSTDQAGNITRYFYDDLDRVEAIEDPRNAVAGYATQDYSVTYSYDDRSRLISARLPLVGSIPQVPEIRFTYDDAGRLTGRTEPDGGTTAYVYDERNFLTSSTVSGRTIANQDREYVTTYTYDGAGNVLTRTIPGLTVSMEYDAFGNLIKQILPSGVNYSATYDQRGHLVHELDGNQHPTAYAYDEIGRLVRITDAEEHSTLYYYDDRGNLALTIDPAGDSFRTVYDERGLAIREINSLNNQWSYWYDAAGNLVGSLDPRATSGAYEYDPRNLLTRADYSNAGEGLPSQYQSFVYDEAGQLIVADDNGVVTTYNAAEGSYLSDPYGLLRSVETAGFGYVSTVEYEYDIMLRMNRLTHTDGTAADYLYNSLGQLEAIPSYIDQIDYDAAGYISGYVMSNGIELDYAYDENLRLDSMNYSANALEIKSYAYEYDDANNITRINENFYSYDRTGQLQSAMLVDDSATYTAYPQMNLEFGRIQEDVLGISRFQETAPEPALSTTSESIVIDLGYGFSVSEITLPVTDINLALLDDEILTVFTSLVNADEAYEQASEPVITLDTSEISIQFSQPIFTRYIKLHSSVHYINADGEAVGFEQLVSIDSSQISVGVSTTGINEFFNYTPDGNRAAKSLFTDALSTEEYEYYSGSDRLMIAGGIAYRYDANGNLTEQGSSYTGTEDSLTIAMSEDYRQYRYDLLNRLTEVLRYQDGNLVTVARYGYDINSLRIYKEDGQGITTHYVYDATGNRLETHSDETSSYYIFRGLRHVARRIVDNASQTEVRHYYGTDHLGSTVLVTGDAGEVLWSGETNPFGDSVSGEGTRIWGIRTDKIHRQGLGRGCRPVLLQCPLVRPGDREVYYRRSGTRWCKLVCVCGQ
jgi:YD repeat-containing protein